MTPASGETVVFAECMAWSLEADMCYRASGKTRGIAIRDGQLVTQNETRSRGATNKGHHVVSWDRLDLEVVDMVLEASGN